MSIISNIRTFLHLDKVDLSITPEFADAVGLYINESKELMKPEFHDCLDGGSFMGSYSMNIHAPHHFDIPISHFPQDLHFIHC